MWKCPRSALCGHWSRRNSIFTSKLGLTCLIRRVACDDFGGQPVLFQRFLRSKSWHYIECL